ncbi:YceI family protein [uncultured Corynebacterium sp.]|uniref:YceI family protein n=1 Tax=uncultured Corynebacterium sp. TaxID=159447 RepID=UPI0028E5C5F3|nr:YceI family protein [uncultured Corynebacterium sp.]
MDTRRKPIIIGGVVIIVLLAVFALGTVVMSLLNTPGVQTPELNADNAKPASTDVGGEWQVVTGDAPNISSVGFTFDEILPSDKRTTSGSTQAVRGTVTVDDVTLQPGGRIEVDMTSINTDTQRRDVNVRTKLFDTDNYPDAAFEVTKPVDLSALPDDGSVGTVTVPGKLTIKGETREVQPEFQAVRDGDKLTVSTVLRFNRLDYGVKTPEFIAAKVSEEGDLNVLLTFKKS